MLVNKNTNKQIANQNKETYRPRLRLKHIQVTSIGSKEHLLYAYSKKYIEYKNNTSKIFNISLENIGNGLVNDISFYMLHTGEKCIGYQVGSINKNQMLNSTLEIPARSIDIVRISINFNNAKEIPKDEDFYLLICNYKDLNKNNNKIIIGIILKNVKGSNNYEEQNFPNYSVNFDCYYYQEGTEAYDNIVNKDIYVEKYKKY